MHRNRDQSMRINRTSKEFLNFVMRITRQREATLNKLVFTVDIKGLKIIAVNLVLQFTSSDRTLDRRACRTILQHSKNWVTTHVSCWWNDVHTCGNGLSHHTIAQKYTKSKTNWQLMHSCSVDTGLLMRCKGNPNLKGKKLSLKYS